MVLPLLCIHESHTDKALDNAVNEHRNAHTPFFEPHTTEMTHQATKSDIKTNIS